MQLLLSTAGPSLAFQRYESGPPLPLAAQRIPTSLCPAGSAASPAVLVYGSPDVVHDPELPALLLSALKFHAPPLYGGSHSSLPSAAGAGRFEVVQRQPPDLSNHTSEHQSAAYVIPFQGPEKMPYALAEGLAIIEVENTTKETTLPLASLRGFVSGGGNLVLLGNTGQERALGLIAAVLGQPHGCQPASARFRISTSAVDSSASSHAGALPHLPPGLPDVFMPLGAAGGEGGSVGLLTCPRHALYPSAVPLFAEVGAWAAGSASSLAGALDGDTLPPWGPATSVVSPGFVWARGRGRVVWLGATFDQHTPVDWVRLLAVAVTAPPRDLEGEAAAQPPVVAISPPPPPPISWRLPKDPPSQPKRPPPSLATRPPSPLSPSSPPSPSQGPGDSPQPARPGQPSSPVNATHAPPTWPPFEPYPPGLLTPPAQPDELPAPPSEPPTPPEPPALPPAPPERPCVDIPATPSLNCTAWLELPDIDVCEPGFVVQLEPGGPDLSVPEDLCPRSCGTCCADQFLQCEEWAGIDGLCSWHWLAVDAGSQQEQTVPEACPESCEVPTCDAAAQPPPLLPPPAPLGNMSNACQGGKVPPPGCSTGGGEGVRRRRILMGGAAKSKKSGTVQERVTPDLPSGSDRKASKLTEGTNSDWKNMNKVLDEMKNLQLFSKMENAGSTPMETIHQTGRSGQRLDRQKPPFSVTTSKGQAVRWRNNEKVSYAPYDYQQGTNSYARVWVPMGIEKLDGDMIKSALRQSFITGRPVAIVPPAETVYNAGGSIATKFKSFSEMDPTSTSWSLVEANVQSKPAGTNAAQCTVVFTDAGWIELTHPRNNIAIADFDTTRQGEAKVRERSVGKWRPQAKPNDCSLAGRRSLLQGCSSGPGEDSGVGSDNGNDIDNDRDCRYRWFRGSDGRPVRRRICTSG